jgi:hypothetical protein
MHHPRLETRVGTLAALHAPWVLAASGPILSLPLLWVPWSSYELVGQPLTPRCLMGRRGIFSPVSLFTCGGSAHIVGPKISSFGAIFEGVIRSGSRAVSGIMM